MDQLKGFLFGGGDNIECSGPEWYMSSLLYSQDIPFWSGTLDMVVFVGCFASQQQSVSQGQVFLVVCAAMQRDRNQGSDLLSYPVTLY